MGQELALHILEGIFIFALLLVLATVALDDWSNKK
jgi:hypothetical protein